MAKTRDPSVRRRPIYTIMLALLAVALLGFAAMRVYERFGEADRHRDAAADDREQAHADMLDGTFNMTGLAIDRSTLLPGGPPVDGIPSLTTTHAETQTTPLVSPTVAAREADFLLDGNRVLGLTIDGEARAYPVKVLTYHEIVNDTLAGQPIAVVFCPLCDSFSVVSRTIGDEVVEFGVSGLLHNSNVVLFDRATRSLWSQVMLEALTGPRAGERLEHLGGWEITTWGDWRKTNPDGDLLSTDTGYSRDYDLSPYVGYAQSNHLYFPVEPLDERLDLKVPVIGIASADRTIAVPVSVIVAGELAPADTLGVKLEATDDGSVRIGALPEGISAVHTYWFAWAAMHPQTKIVDAPGE